MTNLLQQLHHFNQLALLPHENPRFYYSAPEILAALNEAVALCGKLCDALESYYEGDSPITGLPWVQIDKAKLRKALAKAHSLGIGGEG